MASQRGNNSIQGEKAMSTDEYLDTTDNSTLKTQVLSSKSASGVNINEIFNEIKMFF